MEISDSLLIEIQVFIREARSVLALHDRLIEESDKDREVDRTQNQTQITGLVQRIFEIESRLNQKSKETLSTAAYSNERLTLAVEGILLRESLADQKMTSMKRDMQNAIFAGLTALAATFLGGVAVSYYAKPSKAEAAEHRIVSLQSVECKVFPSFPCYERS
jgi:hypothetical protein